MTEDREKREAVRGCLWFLKDERSKGELGSGSAFC